MDASVIYRTGRPTGADYDEAIKALEDAKGQLEPDGHGCIVCGDSGHQAFECRHNPLVVARRRAADETTWRCFHCSAVFHDHAAATEHFGADWTAISECLLGAGNELIREAARTIAAVSSPDCRCQFDRGVLVKFCALCDAGARQAEAAMRTAIAEILGKASEVHL